MTRYALVIGISQYQRRDKLPKATQDAEAIAQLLTDSGKYEVTRVPWGFNETLGHKEMIAEVVEGKQLEKELRTFLKRAERDEALIYFTGHGLVKPSKSGKPKGYLVASDEDNFDLDSLNDLILESPLSNLVVLLDCCHSGNFIEANIFKNTLTAFTAQKDYYFITASRGFEESFAVASDKHSIFTQALLDGMSRERADEKGRVSGDRLFDYISQSPTVSGQEPIRLGWGKSLILVEYPVEKQAAIAFKKENPYRGLQPFESEQANYFKGRETAVRVLIDRLKNNRFLAVIGASGCGKSSLVKAGLLPELKKSNNQLQIKSIKPGDRPLIGLQEILMQPSQPTQDSILFIDQFEEVFTLCKEETERRDFIRAVTAEATIPDKQTRVIITIRSDFIERCADYQEAATLINRDLATTYFVKKLKLEELLAAIEEPARENGVAFEHGLVSQIVNDVEDQPGGLPLLQFALKDLWRVCIEESISEQQLLTKTHYEKIGGVKGALEKQANFVYNNLSDAEKLFVKSLFMELVEVEGDQPVTRRRVTIASLVENNNSHEQLQKQQRKKVLEKLADQRLIVKDEKTVEVAHEALLSEWSLLKKWIDDNRENIRLKRRLEEARRDWESFNKSDDLLLRDPRLSLFKEWQERNKYEISALDAEFLQKSLEKREREVQQQISRLEKEIKLTDEKLKAQKQRTRLAIVVGMLTVFTCGFWFMGQRHKQQAKLNQLVAIGAIKDSISTSERLFEAGEQLDALIASVQDIEKLKNIDPENIDPENTRQLTRIKAVIDKVQERNRLEGHTDAVNGVSLSPIEPKIVSASSDGTLRMWGLNGTPLKTPNIMKHNDKISAVSFSPDGKYIASAGKDRIVKLWNKEGKFIRVFSGHTKGINSVNFDPDSKIILSASSDGTVRLWPITPNSPNNLVEPLIIRAHQAPIWGAEFSPDGKLIASASDDGTIKVWKRDGSPLATLSGHIAAVRYVTFSSNSKIILSASSDNTLRLWEWNTDPKNYNTKEFARVQKPYLVRFSPKDKLIAASNGVDSTVRIWTTTQGTQERYIIGRHKDIVSDFNFSLDSKSIVTASGDRTIRIWNLEPSETSSSQITPDALLRKSCNLLYDYLESNVKVRNHYQNIKEICLKYKK